MCIHTGYPDIKNIDVLSNKVHNERGQFFFGLKGVAGKVIMITA